MNEKRKQLAGLLREFEVCAREMELRDPGRKRDDEHVPFDSHFFGVCAVIMEKKTGAFAGQERLHRRIERCFDCRFHAGKVRVPDACPVAAQKLERAFRLLELFRPGIPPRVMTLIPRRPYPFEVIAEDGLALRSTAKLSKAFLELDKDAVIVSDYQTASAVSVLEVMSLAMPFGARGTVAFSKTLLVDDVLGHPALSELIRLDRRTE